MVFTGGDSIVFGDPTSSSRLELPRSGEKFLFVRAKGKEGPKASPWTPVDEFLTVERELAELNSLCDCGHKMKEHHPDGTCGALGCHCGDEAYQDVPGMEIDSPREVSTQDSTGGFSICQ
jgi:hypothetical protein